MLKNVTRLVMWPVVTSAAMLVLLGGVSPVSAAPVQLEGVSAGQPSAEAGVDPHIIGGHAASQPYPGMASLQRLRGDDPDFHFCGTTLVSGRYAVVNAHCVTLPGGTSRPPASLHLRIGSADRTTGGVVVGVTAILPHAEWDWATGTDRVADLAMLRLDSYVQLQPFEVAPSLAGRSAVTREIGWGVTEPSGEGPAPFALQELDTRLVPATLCAAGGITVGEICVGNVNGTDGACAGDSGSPALQRVTANRWQVVGGASRETAPFCGTAPSIYTDLTYYRDWMYQVMRTGVVPPRVEGSQAAPALVRVNGERWLCRSDLALCS